MIQTSQNPCKIASLLEKGFQELNPYSMYRIILSDEFLDSEFITNGNFMMNKNHLMSTVWLLTKKIEKNNYETIKFVPSDHKSQSVLVNITSMKIQKCIDLKTYLKSSRPSMLRWSSP